MDNLCKLCQKAPANQTGSHLLSAFMVESMIGKRDQEIGYQITSNADLDYRKNVGADPIKQDNIICRGCEQRLSFLESYISAEFTQKVDDEKYSSNFEMVMPSGILPYKKCLRVNSRAFALLIYSILWRAAISAAMFKDFRMLENVVESLRDQLNKLLPPYENFKVKAKPKDWANLLNKSTDFICYPFIVLKCENIMTHDKSRNVIFAHPNFTQPYHFLANEFLILFFNESNVSLSQDYFLLQEKFGDISHLINNCDILKIGILTEEQWNQVLDVLKEALKKQKQNAIKKKLFLQFSEEQGRIPNEGELNKLYADYLDSQPKPDWERE